MKPSVVYVHEVARRTARRALRRNNTRTSTPAQVLIDYEQMRQAHLKEFLASDWPVEEYAIREPVGRRTMTLSTLLDGVVGMDFHGVRTRTMTRLSETVARYAPTDVVEAGSGTGRNLVWLGHTLRVRGLGLELTPSGVEAGRLAVERYGLDLRFQVADLLDPATEIPQADVVYSLHALEQIPHPKVVVEKMVRAARKAVVMIEPFPEYWPGGLAKVAHRMRAEDWDRLRAGSLEGHPVSSAELLPFGTVVNRSIEVVIEK